MSYSKMNPSQSFGEFNNSQVLKNIIEDIDLSN